MHSNILSTALCLLLPACALADDAALARLKEQPITTAQGEVGKLLRAWHQEGTAAGNVGDFYDNRDGAHSDLNIKPYPQLQRIVYSEEDIKLRRHWAAQRTTLPHVVFGNSSTSAAFETGGSNVRMYYNSPIGLQLLYNHYTHNNIYIYPEHRDHDPGHNGRNDGYGDAYPTNTPYLITSQGSSGSDQPFMRAIPFTLAAFRPEVKKKLTDTGLLMPTLQMILRSTAKHLKDPAEYLTGRAHPTVFEGSSVNDLEMVKLAHAIELDNIPPMVQIKVVEEDEPKQNVDFFEPRPVSEKHSDTPAVIARIFRGKEMTRRMVVSAEDSFDANKRPLTFKWVVLRGDADRIKITPKNDRHSVVELIVPYHERRPISPGSPMESNRVDIGVFVHNGVYHSAPAFITYLSLDGEARTYDDKGRILEIGHGVGEVRWNIADWALFFEAASGNSASSRLLNLSQEQRTALAAAAPAYRVLQKSIADAQAKSKSAAETRAKLANAATEDEKLQLKKADEELQAAQKEVTAGSKAANDFLDRKQPELGEAPRALVLRVLSELAQTDDFHNRNARVLVGLLKDADPKRQNDIKSARKRLVDYGVIKNEQGDSFDFTPLRRGDGPLWTKYEKSLLERYNAAVISSVLFPGIVTSTYYANYVDPRIASPKTWRDVYRYDDKDRLVGWTRYDAGKIADFDADGTPKNRNTSAAPAQGTRGMVSTAHPLATRVGLEVLENGGNAFDAAVAVSAALNVVEPMMSGMGGFGVILIYDADKRTLRCLDASGRFPALTDADVFRAPTPNFMNNRKGAKAISTPGNANAWETLSKEHGKLPWKQLLGPAIKLADEGFVITAHTAKHIQSEFPIFPEHAKTYYGKEGKPLVAGDRLVQKDLARSLRLLAEQGARALHGGELGAAIDKTMRETGGFLRLDDLKNNQAEWWEPVSIDYRGHRVIASPLPNNAWNGLYRLGIMSQFDLKKLGHNSAEHLHIFGEATKLAYAARLQHAGDREQNPPLDRLLSAKQWVQEAAKIDVKKAHPLQTPPASKQEEHTTHFVVADAHGNVVTSTQTLGMLFGSKVMAPGTGIWLNNSMQYCTFEPKGNPLDAIAGRRKLAGFCPMIVMKDARPWIAVGSPGGHTIVQTVPQIVMNMIDFRMDVQQAIAAPRLSFVEPDITAVDEGVPESVRQQLSGLGHNIRVQRLGNAHGLTIEYDTDGRPQRFTGGSDPRGEGAAVGR